MIPAKCHIAIRKGKFQRTEMTHYDKDNQLIRV